MFWTLLKGGRLPLLLVVVLTGVTNGAGWVGIPSPIEIRRLPSFLPMDEVGRLWLLFSEDC